LILFCQHTKYLRQKWRDFQIKLKQEEEQRRLRYIEEEEHRCVQREKWKAEHEIKMKTDPVYAEEYRKQELKNMAIHYNVLRIMSGCAGLSYTN